MSMTQIKTVVISSTRLIIDYHYLTADQCEDMKSKALAHAKQYKWGSFGPDGTGKEKWSRLIDLSTEHLENILITQPQVTPEYRAAILAIIKDRI